MKIILFNEKTIELYLKKLVNTKWGDISAPGGEQFLKINIDHFLSELGNEVNQKSIIIQSKPERSSVKMVEIKGEQFPSKYETSKQKRYSYAKVVYTFGFEGDSELLSIRPRGYSISRPIEIEVNKKTATFTIEKQTYFGNPTLSKEIEWDLTTYLNRVIEEMQNTLTQLNSELINKSKSTLKSILIDKVGKDRNQF